MKEKGNWKHRILSGVLTLAMVLGLFQGMVFSNSTLQAAAAEGDVLLALGDSISTGYGLTNKDTESFAAIMAKDLNLTLDNRAVDGYTCDALKTLVTGGSINSNISAADIITITIGGNDMMAVLYSEVAKHYNTTYSSITGKTVKASDVAAMLTANDMYMLFSALAVLPKLPESEAFTAALNTFKTQFSSTLSAIQEKNSTARIIVATQYNPYKWLGVVSGLDIPEIMDRGVSKLNAIITDSVNGAGNNCIVADVYRAFNSSSANLCNPTQTPLNLDFHPNAAGHKVIVASMKSATAAGDIFTVSYTKTENNVSTFTITRSTTANIANEETVYYRTINGAAIADVHYKHVDGALVFAANEKQKTVTVTEIPVTSIKDKVSRYQAKGSERSYELEVYSLNTPQTRAKRVLDYGENYLIDPALFSGEALIYDRSESKVHGDVDDDKLGVSKDSYPGHVDTIPLVNSYLREYLNAGQIGFTFSIGFRLSMTSKEINDGYQSVFVKLTDSAADNMPNATWTPREGGWVQNIIGALVSDATSFYQMVSMQDSVGSLYHDVAFPKKDTADTTINKVNYRDSHIVGDIRTSTALSDSNSYFVSDNKWSSYAQVAYSGSGSGNDKWESSNLKAYMRIRDQKDITFRYYAPVRSGSKGDKIKISVVFDRIVTVKDGSKPRLSTIGANNPTDWWGYLGEDFEYVEGAGTNILVFEGRLSSNFDSNYYYVPAIYAFNTILSLSGKSLPNNQNYESGADFNLSPRPFVYMDPNGTDSIYSGNYDNPVKTLPKANKLAGSQCKIALRPGEYKNNGLEIQENKSLDFIGTGWSPNVWFDGDFSIWGKISAANINWKNSGERNNFSVKRGGAFDFISGTMVGGGVYAIGMFNMYGGSIQSNNEGLASVGVDIDQGTFNMYNGTISGFKSNKGGGVLNYGGIFNMYNGTITNNTATADGGGVCNYEGTFNMYGGTIMNNEAKGYGGGVCNLSGVSNLSGSIKNNTAVLGGGVYNRPNVNNTTMYISNGCQISNNTATDQGGGIFGNITSITGSTVSDNTATDQGGGIFGNITSITGSTVSDNTATNQGGGIYGSVQSITDSVVSGNTATKGSGGGIYFSNTDKSISLSNSCFYLNKAQLYGGAIYTTQSISISGKILAINNYLWDNTFNNISIYKDPSGAFRGPVLRITGALDSGSQIGINTTGNSGGVAAEVMDGGSYDRTSIGADQQLYYELIHSENQIKLERKNAVTPTAIISTDKTDIATGETATLSLQSSDIEGHTLSFQWYKNDEIIPGATNKIYTVTAVEGIVTDNYYCIVTSERISNGLTATAKSNVVPIKSNYRNTWEDVARLAVLDKDYSLDVNGNVNIYTAEGLAWFAKKVNDGDAFAGKTAALLADIDLMDANVVKYGTATIEQNSWIPIGNRNDYGSGEGTNTLSFQGTFDGGGYTISNLFIGGNNSAGYNQSILYPGLFGYSDGGVLKNTNVTVKIYVNKTGASVGGLVGKQYGASARIENCSVSGRVRGGGLAYFTGGLLGSNFYGTVLTSSSSAEVQLEALRTPVGGLVGLQTSGTDGIATIENGFATGTVIGASGSSGGGLIGESNEGSVIKNCFATGVVQGIIGFNGYSGGLAGIVRNSGKVENCYYNNANKFGINAGDGKATGRSLSEFATLEMAWLLNTAGLNKGEAGYSHSNIWSQNGSTPIFADAANKPIYKVAITGAITDSVYTKPSGKVDSLPDGYEYTYRGEEFTADTLVTEDITIATKGSEVVSVTVTWGSMEFTYTDATWNGQTHEYEGGGWQCEENQNEITVLNESESDLLVRVAYESEVDHKEINGNFNNEKDTPSTSLPLHPNQPQVFMLNLTGKPEDELPTVVIGRITVMIGDQQT